MVFGMMGHDGQWFTLMLGQYIGNTIRDPILENHTLCTKFKN